MSEEQPERKKLTPEQRDIIDEFMSNYVDDPNNRERLTKAFHVFLEDIINTPPPEKGKDDGN